ncbi:MAG TPA: hypothetical protein VHG91_15990 [Longimicrobium sp.]|nr:hypothetical protein [Longimicrobium sp.]
MAARKPATRRPSEPAPDSKPRSTDYIISRTGERWALKQGRRVVETFATRAEAVHEVRALIQGTDADAYVRSNSGRYLLKLDFSEATELLMQVWQKRHERYLRTGE